MLALALRHLLSRKRQTLLTLTGILLGTTAYVAVSGMMLGFQTFIIRQLVDNDSHVRISAREELLTEHGLDRDFFPGAAVAWLSPPSGRKDEARILYPQGWFSRLDADPAVLAYSPQLKTQVILRRAKSSAAAALLGVHPAMQQRVTTVADYMVSGRFDDLHDAGNRIVVGRELLERLGARVSETVVVSAGKGVETPFKVVGSFRFGIKHLDESLAFAALVDVQRVNRTPSELTDIAVRLTDVRRASERASTWVRTSREKVQSWDQANEGIMSVFKTQDIVRYAMSVTILVVAGFGIYNVLAMTVAGKRRDIAILRSMGYEPRDVVRLFLIQGVILGSLGGLLGMVLGYGLCLRLELIEVSKDRGLGMGHMLMSYAPRIYVQGFLLAFLSSAAAAYLPSRAAGRLEPIDIVRSEGG